MFKSLYVKINSFLNWMKNCIENRDDTSIVSLQIESTKSINRILQECGLSSIELIDHHILEKDVFGITQKMIDYYEESDRLYPQFIICKGSLFIDRLPNRQKYIYEVTKFEKGIIPKALKLCAPLCSKGWIIFAALKNQGTIEWGVFSTDASEISTDVETLVKAKECEPCVLLIRSIVNNSVEFISSGFENHLIISANLKGIDKLNNDKINTLCKELCSSIKDSQTFNYAEFISKIIHEVIITGHGNLIAIVEGNNVPEIFNEGITLKQPIDIYGAFLDASLINTNGLRAVMANYRLHNLRELVVSMMNHDGITLFNTESKVLGYHYIINNANANSNHAIGGARTRAFAAMKESNEIKVSFIKKQEGDIDININPDYHG